MSFQPDGYYAWDLWFAHDGEKQHIYYLQASKEACGHDLHKRHNLSGVGHAVLKDANFVEVSREPVFSASTADNAWDNLSIWTGSIIKDPDSNKYLMFYTARRREDEPIWTPSEYQRPQNIGLAFSEDLIHWKRHPLSIDKPVIANPGKDNEMGFDGVAWRDPYLIKIGDWYLFNHPKHSLRSSEFSASVDYAIEHDIPIFFTDKSTQFPGMGFKLTCPLFPYSFKC